MFVLRLEHKISRRAERGLSNDEIEWGLWLLKLCCEMFPSNPLYPLPLNC